MFKINLPNENSDDKVCCTQEWGVGNPIYDGALSIVIIGASGNLARTKTYPSLFRIFKNNLMPVVTSIFGYARSKLTNEEFREMIRKELDGTEDEIERFLDRLYYHPGAYDNDEDYLSMTSELETHEHSMCKIYMNNTKNTTCSSNRLFYLAIPPSLFIQVATSLNKNCRSAGGFNHLIIEKPFGRDLTSCKDLNDQILSLFNEDEIYRIDHYLGKEMVQNLLVLRFGNLLLSPLWNNLYIDNVQIIFKEKKGVNGRGGYFDQYAMEQPVSLAAHDIRDEKAKVLKSIPPLKLEEVVVGQYGRDETDSQESYREDPSVPADSLTSTFAAAIMHINNNRWAGVPFYLKCGKGLDEDKAEIRIQFKSILAPLFGHIQRDELVIRVQPDTSIYMKMNVKSPGLTTQPMLSELDLTYKQRYDSAYIPDAYEKLIIDCMRGDHSHFVRTDELEGSWRIFTPLLHQIEDKKVVPISYPRGSRGPYQWKEPILKSA
ncbi:hypothetical protein WA158_004945 [Blastocystis sp. Blastoise]